MAITVAELAYMVDSAIDICIATESPLGYTLRINGGQIRIGAGPELQDVVGLGSTPDDARDDYAVKVAGKVMVFGGNPRGFTLRIPTTIVGS